MRSAQLVLSPIGFARTPHTSKYTAPRQPGTSRRRITGTIHLHEGHNFEQALSDLEGFEYIWVLFWFDRNTGWKPKVLPPASDRKKRGLFATRSPHRPNPLGLSLCKLLRVKGRTLTVENPDFLDGTPILDIKPYLAHAEAKPEARIGWLTGVYEGADERFAVSVARTILVSLRRLDPAGRSEILAYLRSALSRDPHPHAYRRIRRLQDGSMQIAVKRWRFVYNVKGNRVRVVKGWREGEDTRGQRSVASSQCSEIGGA